MFGDMFVLCDVSRGTARPVILTQDRNTVFLAVHSLAHPGTRATRRILSSQVVWRGMASDIAAWCRDCQDCCKAKVTAQPSAPIQPIPVPARRFSHIHVDIVGPLPASAAGFQFVLTIIARTTRWVEAIPLPNIEEATCSEDFVSDWLSRFRVPATVLTDKGTQFCSATWSDMCRKMGIHHITTPLLTNPQSNGMVEGVHRQLKDSLRAWLAGPHLPWVLLGLRFAPIEDSSVSSAELVLGILLTLPGQLSLDKEVPQREVARALKSLQPPATMPLTYAQAAASIPASFFFSQPCLCIFEEVVLHLSWPKCTWGPTRFSADPTRFSRSSLEDSRRPSQWTVLNDIWGLRL
jgi:transposase InsO family protein